MFDRRRGLALAAAFLLAGLGVGCVSQSPGPLEKRLFLVFFDVDSAVLTPLARDTLAQLPPHLKANPASRILIEGHTDAVGTPEGNLALGVKRAAAVRAYLTDAGVAGDRITTLSYGQENANALGDVPRASALLRRVVVKIE